MRFQDPDLNSYVSEGGDVLDASTVSGGEAQKEEEEYYDEDEEYYEDYTLPTTHQNVMSSRRSFRRKLETEPVPTDPDAERIERVVKAGELTRHNSIRRKIIPQPEDFAEDVQLRQKSARLRQLPESEDEGNCESLTSEITRLEDMLNERPDSLKFEGSEHIFTPLEAETVARIRECMNMEKFRDLYQLGSKLQDLLSTVEIDEIVRNGDKFSSVIDPEIVRILTESVGSFSAPSEKTEQKPKKKIVPPEALEVKPAPIGALSPINSESEEEEEVRRVTPDLISKRPLSQTFSVVGNESVGMSPTKQPVSRSGTQHSPGRMKPQDSDGKAGGRRSSETMTPDDLEESILERLPPRPDLIPEASAYEEREDDRRWRNVVISGLEKRLDVRVIEPYKKVLSHGGYAGASRHTAIIVFSACHLPDRSRKDYDYVMDNLFLYVLITLDALVAEDYILVYLHGATPRSCMPSLGWIRRCYQLVDRRLRKNLKTLYIVHPTLWLKTLVTLSRPFVSSKFSRKLTFVPDLVELEKTVPIDPLSIPDRVKQYDVIKQALEHGV